MAETATLILCTRNRAAQLRTALESIARSDCPQGFLREALIVDNGSSDETPDVIASFAGRLPVRRIFEPTPGLSNARNTGLAGAQGDYIIWTDDDVEVGQTWLSAYAQAFAANPEAALFAGRVTPVLDGEKPDWWDEASSEFEGLLARRDFGPVPITLSLEANRLPFGANFAVRTRDQKAHRYDPHLGVSPHQKRLGEETKVARAILKSGAAGMWVPTAEVFHHIPAARLTEDYVETYFRSVGDTWAYLDARGEDNFMGPPIAADARRIGGAPLWVWRKLVQERAAYAATRKFTTPRVWIKHLRMAAFCTGALNYWRAASARKP